MALSGALAGDEDIRQPEGRVKGCLANTQYSQLLFLLLALSLYGLLVSVLLFVSVVLPVDSGNIAVITISEFDENEQTMRLSD